MREILFRGKRLDNGEWVYGFVAKIDCYKHGKQYEETVIVDQLKYDDRDYYVQEFIYADAVDTETIGQYTGLKDRNGVEIYEGDILRNVDNPYVDKLPFAVWWNEYYGAWFWWSELGDVGTDRFYQSIASGCEVIGTLYDNPELMGEKK